MDFLIWHLLRKSAERSPEKEALAHGEERLAYGQVARRVDGLAAGLRSAGLRRGDRMGIYLEASVPQVISIFGISRAEAVYVPINVLLHAPPGNAHRARLRDERSHYDGSETRLAC